ncbi:hypothetical protein BBK82_10540 [Lentzea guizhouensis]|uniref:Gram-positive cocci surface proteins LPxTG domain-containing protein n=1 Tax=Lentzea guizhouensis TaxID=1586287 RepID=A0A1B2HFC8_9PSEU|nr:hypothetical protein BBK82_10540 [Lentzea guizhouensis]
MTCAFLLISTSSAHAGGWAVTYLDPVPSFQADVPHTIGYRVLQHGTRPFEGDLGGTRWCSRCPPASTRSTGCTLLVKPVDPALVLTVSPEPAASVTPAEIPREPLPVWLVGLVVAGVAGLLLALRKRLRLSRR